jgi:hypothetical protein
MGGCRSLAQLVEHRSPKPRVVGSSPPTPASSSPVYSAYNSFTPGYLFDYAPYPLIGGLGGGSSRPVSSVAEPWCNPTAIAPFDPRLAYQDGQRLVKAFVPALLR